MLSILLMITIIYLLDKFNIFEGFFKYIKKLTLKDIIIAVIAIVIFFIFVIVIFGLPRP